MWLNKFKFFLFYIFVLNGSIFSATIIHSPIKVGVSSLPILIEASLDQPNEYLWARLFVKRKFENQYFTIPMQGSGLYFYTRIPKEYVIKEGTSYYIEVTLQNQNVIRLPTKDQFTIQNSTSQSQYTLHIISPQEDKPLDNIKNNYTFAALIRGIGLFNDFKENIKLYLDEQAVSININEGYTLHKPPKKLIEGSHVYKLHILDENGTLLFEKEIPFYVEINLTPEEKIALLKKGVDEKKIHKKSNKKFKTSGYLKASYQYAKTSSETSTPLANPDGYYILQSQVESSYKDLNFIVGPLSFTSQKSDPSTRLYQYSFGFSKQAFKTKWGIISSKLSVLTASGLSFLGGEIIWSTVHQEKKSGYSLKGFYGESRPAVEVFNDPNFLGLYAQHTGGTQIEWYAIPKKLLLSLQFIDTRDKENSIKSQSLQLIRENQSSSILFQFFSSNKYIKTIDFEYGFNHNIIKSPTLNNSLDIVFSKSRSFGHSIISTLRGNIPQIQTSFQTNFQWANPHFFTVFGTNQADIIKLGFSMSHNLIQGQINLNHRIDISFDNLEKQKDSTNYIQLILVSLSLQFKKLPTFSFSNNLQNQSSTNLERILQQLNNSFSTSISYSKKINKTQLSPNVSYQRNDSLDLSPNQINQSTSVSNYGLGIGIKYTPITIVSMTFNQNYSFNETLTKMVDIINNYTGISNVKSTIGFHFNFTPKKIKKLIINFPIQSSYSLNLDHKIDQEVYTENISIQGGSELNINKTTFNINISYSWFINRIKKNSSYTQLSVNFNSTFQF